MPQAPELRRSGRIARGLLALLAAVALQPPPEAIAKPFAGRITAANHARLSVGGPDAVGGIGDWALTNGTLCAVVSDPSHEGDIATTGGTLIDLGLCGRADDQFLLFEQLANLSIRRAIPFHAVEADTAGSLARVIARGELDGLAVETVYELDATRPRLLRIRSLVERRSAGQPLFGFGLAFGNVYSLRPFTLGIERPDASRGFRQVAFFGRGSGAAASAAHAADLVVLVGEALLEPGIAYGVRRIESRLERQGGERVDVPQFVLADDLATIFASFTSSFWFGGDASLSWWKLLQTRFMDLAPGQALVFEYEIWVGDRADVASVTNLVFAAQPELSGRVDDPAATIHLQRPDGTPVSQARADAEGRFAIRAPEGAYRMRVVAPGAREVAQAVELERPGTDVGRVALTGPARVELPRGQPMRLVFIGKDGAPDPRFGDDLLGFSLEGGGRVRRTAGVRRLSLAGVASDPRTVVVAPGRYRVLATRGPEYSVTEAWIDAFAGASVPLEIESPVRELDTAGWISADFHVHAARSGDNSLPLGLRFDSLVAEGAEVMVASEHDVAVDYAPALRKRGLASVLAAIPGLEVTSEVWTEVAPRSIGHANTFPFKVEPRAFRGGAVANEGRRWRDVIAELRARPGERIVQLNHPRRGDGSEDPRAFLSHLGRGTPYDPSRRLDEEPNRTLAEPDPTTGVRDIDFDAMELLNGAGLDAYERTRRDWHSLLRQGVRLTATANSDTHTLRSVAAAPRNYVPLEDDRPARLDVPSLVRAVREGRSFGTTGPFVSVRLGSAGMGDTFAGREGSLVVEAQAASWVPVSEARVYVNGEETAKRRIGSGERIVVPLRFERDAYVTVEVRGEARKPYSLVLPRFEPLAFTNPIYVDADADGAWTPPGL